MPCVKGCGYSCPGTSVGVISVMSYRSDLRSIAVAEAELVAKCVEQITEMFCKPGSPKPVVVDHYVADWAKEEFVR